MKYNSIVCVIFLACLFAVITETQAMGFRFFNPFDNFKYLDNYQYYTYRAPNVQNNNKYVNRITPHSDIFETETEIIIQTNLPGVSTPSVEVEGTTLTISGKFDYEPFPFEFRKPSAANNYNNNNDVNNNKNNKDGVDVKNIKEKHDDDDDENINVNFTEAENEVDRSVEEKAQEFVTEKVVFEGRYLKRERALQSDHDEYYQQFQLNVNFDEKNIEAKMKNGVLTIIIPKIQPVKVPIVIS